MTRMQNGLSVIYTQCIRVIDQWSMTRMLTEFTRPGFFSPVYRAVNDTNAFWSMTQMQKGLSVNYTQCICVIDQWSMTRMLTELLAQAFFPRYIGQSMTPMPFGQ